MRVRARTVAVAACLLVGASCSSGGGASQDADRVGDCLEKAGYGHPPDNVDYQRQQDAKFDAAMTRCYRGIGVELPAAGRLTRSLDQMVLAEVRCLRDLGWDVPDPERGEEGALDMGNLDDFLAEDQLTPFLADDQACMDRIAPPGKPIDLNDPLADK